jgi:hypothetical protein
MPAASASERQASVDDDIFGAVGLRRELFLSGLRLAAGEVA